MRFGTALAAGAALLPCCPPARADDYRATCRHFSVLGVDRTAACLPGFYLSDGQTGVSRTLRLGYTDGGRPVAVDIVFTGIENTPNPQVHFASIAVGGQRFAAAGRCSFIGLGVPAAVMQPQVACQTTGAAPTAAQLSFQADVDVAATNAQWAAAVPSPSRMPAEQQLTASVGTLARLLPAVAADGRMPAQAGASAMAPPPSPSLSPSPPSPPSSPPTTRAAVAGAGRSAAASQAPGAVPSDDARAVFGMLVGARLVAPRCRDGQDLAPGQPWCASAGAVDAALGDLSEPRADAYRKLGGRSWTVRVNGDIFDTSLLYALPLLGTLNHVQIWVTPDATTGGTTLQALELNTRLDAADAITAMLTRKFGPPTRRTFTDWTDRQTGRVAARTPRLEWSTPQHSVEYEARIADLLVGSPGAMGSVKIVATDFQRRALQSQKENAPPPKRGI